MMSRWPSNLNFSMTFCISLTLLCIGLPALDLYDLMSSSILTPLSNSSHIGRQQSQSCMCSTASTEEPRGRSLHLFFAAQQGCGVHGDGVRKLPAVLLLCVVLLKVLKKHVAFFYQLCMEKLSFPANGLWSMGAGECSAICCSDWIHLFFMFADTINRGCRHSALLLLLGWALVSRKGSWIPEQEVVEFGLFNDCRFFCQQYTIFWLMLLNIWGVTVVMVTFFKKR